MLKQGDIVVCKSYGDYHNMVFYVLEREEDRMGMGMLQCQNRGTVQWFAEEKMRLATPEEKYALLAEFLLL